MTNKAEVCGWQPKGNSEDIPKPPKFNTDELSVEKLQEQLNTIKAALIVIRADIEEHNQIYDLSVDTALLLEGIDGIAFDALAAIGGDDESLDN
ncbi:hypothetical protein AAAQ13_11710 [Lactococcus lactis subsp. lactis]|uniref:hypothetical protein n=1 Tax=Lactococcus lactis TaxID=1358 RepID=UPI00311DB92D